MSFALVRYEQARTALAAAHRIDEVKDIRDKAEALRAYARQAGDIEMFNWAAEIKLRAERRAGEMLSDMAERGERALSGKESHRETLKTLGLAKNESHRWQRAAAVPEPEFEAYIEAAKQDGRELTSAGVRKLAKQSAPRRAAVESFQDCCTVHDLARFAETGVRCGTVYADPPWQYGNQGTRAATGDHYIGLSVDEICALPVAQFAAESAHLHLWTTCC